MALQRVGSSALRGLLHHIELARSLKCHKSRLVKRCLSIGSSASVGTESYTRMTLPASASYRDSYEASQTANNSEPDLFSHLAGADTQASAGDLTRECLVRRGEHFYDINPSPAISPRYSGVYASSDEDAAVEGEEDLMYL